MSRVQKYTSPHKGTTKNRDRSQKRIQAKLTFLAHDAGFDTVNELCEALGVSRHHLREVIIGNRSSKRLKTEICRHLKIEHDELFGAAA